MNPFRIRVLLAGGIVGMAAVILAPGAPAQTAMPPYTLAVSPGTPPAGATKPDDLAVSANGKHLWVGYGNGETDAPRYPVIAPNNPSPAYWKPAPPVDGKATEANINSARLVEAPTNAVSNQE